MQKLLVTSAVLLVLLVGVGIAVRVVKNQGPGSLGLDDLIERLGDADYEVRDAAVEELVRRGRQAPETVIPLLVTTMRTQAKEIFKGRLPPGHPPVELYVVVDPPVEGATGNLWPGDAASYEAFVQAHLEGKPTRLPNPRLKVAIPKLPEPTSEGDGDEAAARRKIYVLGVPRLPIGVWVFGTSTIFGGGSQVILEVQSQVRDDYRAFARRHKGRTLAFAAGNDVLALHVVDDPEADRVRLDPFTDDERGKANLARVAAQGVTSFHDGYTEAGRVLARLGEGVRPALEGLAAMGLAEARVAAWTWWRMETDEARGAGDEAPEGATAPGTR